MKTLTGPEKFYSAEEMEIIDSIEHCFATQTAKFGGIDGRKALKVGVASHYTVESRNSVAQAYINVGWYDVTHMTSEDNITHFTFVA